MKEETGQYIPSIDEAPTLASHLAWVFNGFMDLSNTRLVSQAGYHAIAHAEILAYSQLEDLYGEDLEEFRFFISKLDAKFIEIKNGEYKKKLDTMKQQSKAKGRNG